MNYIKPIRIFLLILIVIGVGLIITQKIWVPRVVDRILKSDFQEIKADNFKNTTETNSKEIISTNGAFSLRYPSDWKLSSTTNIHLPVDVSRSEFLLTSPDGLCSVALTTSSEDNAGEPIQRDYRVSIPSPSGWIMLQRYINKNEGPEPLFLGTSTTPYLPHEFRYAFPIVLSNKSLILFPTTDMPVTYKCNQDFESMARSVSEYLAPNTLDSNSVGTLSIWKRESIAPQINLSDYPPKTSLIFQDEDGNERKLVFGLPSDISIRSSQYGISNNKLYYLASLTDIDMFDIFTRELKKVNIPMNPDSVITDIYPIKNNIYYIQTNQKCYHDSDLRLGPECVVRLFKIDTEENIPKELTNLDSAAYYFEGMSGSKLYIHGNTGTGCVDSYYTFDISKNVVEILTSYHSSCNNEDPDRQLSAVDKKEFDAYSKTKEDINNLLKNQRVYEIRVTKGLLTPITPKEYMPEPREAIKFVPSN